MLAKRHRAFNVTIILISWLSLLFLEKRHIKRFFPAAVITILYEIIDAKVGQKRKWWVFFHKNKSFVSNELPFCLGPFFIGAIWILRLTYGNFKKFILLNAVVNAFFAYMFTKFLEKTKIARLGRLTEFQFFLYLFYKIPLLYGAQYFIEKKWQEGR